MMVSFAALLWRFIEATSFLVDHGRSGAPVAFLCPSLGFR